jgi:hypothetical protein
MRRPSRNPRCLPPGKTMPEALSSTDWSAAAAGRRGQSPHVFIDVRRTSTRPLFTRSSRAPSRPHALPRLLQAVILASTTVDPTNTPNGRGRPLGRLPGRTIGCPTIQGNRRGRSGSGAEKDSEFSALPAVIAHSGDFAPTPTAPGHLLSRAPPPSPVRSDVGGG